MRKCILEVRTVVLINNMLICTAGGIFLGEIREGASRNLLYQRIWKWNLDQNLIMDLLIVAVCPVLFSKLRRQELCNFPFKMFNIKIFKILKMFKYSMKFIRAAYWINSKISNRGKSTRFIIFLFFNYCWSLLLCFNYWRSSMLLNSTSWISLKSTVQT